MSEAFKKAQEYVKKNPDTPSLPFKADFLGKFKQGEFVIDIYSSIKDSVSIEEPAEEYVEMNLIIKQEDMLNYQDRKDTFKHPDRFGMNKKTEINEELYEQVKAFAKARKLNVECIMGAAIPLSDESKNVVGVIHLDGFEATTPELFEAIGKEIYGLRK